MAIQSNISATSLFEGVTSQLQGSQGQGTGVKDDAFSKMMDRMIADAADRKRDQLKDSARQAQDARAEARAEAAKRQQAVRAERPRPDNSRPDISRLDNSRLDSAATLRPKDDPPPSPEKADAKPAPREDKTDTLRARDDATPRKTDGAKTDRAKTEKATDKAEASATDDTTADAARADDSTVATVDEETTGGADAEAAGDGGRTQDSAEDETTDGRDAILTASETVVETTTSDTLLASLQWNGVFAMQTNTKTDTANTDGTTTDGAAQANAAAKTADPAAELAAKLAQTQQVQAAGGAGADAAGATKAAGKAGDSATTDPLAGALTTAKADDAAAQELPTDDTAIPTSFADLIAAAKTKMGEKAGGKGAGTDAGAGRNDRQPSPNLMQAAAPPPPGLDALKTTADSQAMGALTGTAAASATSAVGEAGHTHAGTAAQTHAALAAMEAPRAAGQIDMTQAAAGLRPSRGSAAAPQGVPDQVAVHIKKNVADEVDQFTINLHPAELGRIDIKLDIGADGRVSAMVAVEKAQTLELLQRDSKGLERALQDAGLQTDSNSLNFSLRGEGNQSQADGSGKRGRGPRGGGDGEEDPGLSAAYTVSVGDGRLDIKA